MNSPARIIIDQPHERHSGRAKWLVLLTVMVGMMASITSSTIVNVAVPDMSRHFQIGQDRAQWISAAFMASTTLSLLITPWLLRRYGLRRTYIGANRRIRSCKLGYSCIDRSPWARWWDSSLASDCSARPICC